MLYETSLLPADRYFLNWVGETLKCSLNSLLNVDIDENPDMPAISVTDNSLLSSILHALDNLRLLRYSSGLQSIYFLKSFLKWLVLMLQLAAISSIVISRLKLLEI